MQHNDKRTRRDLVLYRLEVALENSQNHAAEGKLREADEVISDIRKKYDL